MNKCAVDGEACIGIRFESASSFSQCAGEREGIAGQLRAGSVSLVFARTRDSKLNQGRSNGSEDQHQQGGEAAAAVAIIAAHPRLQRAKPNSPCAPAA